MMQQINKSSDMSLAICQVHSSPLQTLDFVIMAFYDHEIH